MNGLELLKKMKSNDECWRIFQNYISIKEDTVKVRLNKLDHVFHKEKVKIEKGNLDEATKSAG